MKRNCPSCNIEIFYENKSKFIHEIRHNFSCRICSTTRKCPTCNNIIEYSGKCLKKKADKCNEICEVCYKQTSEYIELVKNRKAKKKENQIKSWTLERRKERSEKYSGTGNSFYGKRHTSAVIEKFRNKDFTYTKTEKFSERVSNGMENSKTWQIWKENNKGLVDIWKRTLSSEEAAEKEFQWKRKLSICNSGENNPMFGKPAPFKAGNGIQGWYKEFYFRSLRELSYVLYLELENKKWRSGETMKIPYEIDGIIKNYFPDFIVDEIEVVECKPAYLIETKLVSIKTEFALKFCEKLGMKYTILDPRMISLEKLSELVKDDQVKLLEKTVNKLSLRHPDLF